MMLRIVVLVLVAATAAPLGAADSVEAPGLSVAVSVGVAGPAAAVVSDRFVSVNIDAGQVTHFPYNNTALRSFAAQLGGRSYLRVGGTTGDEAYYDMSGQSPPQKPPPGYAQVYTAADIDGLCDFATSVGMKVVMGLNAGKGPRNNTATGAWTPDNARELLQYAHSNHPECFYGWELGNEPNLWLFNYGLLISAQQLVKDFQAARALIDGINDKWVLVGNDVAFQIPIVGELFPTYTDWMKDGGGAVVDVITWHWYPLESSDCPLGGFPITATTERGISPATLSKDIPYRDLVLKYAQQYAPHAKVWLGEMSEVSCGGSLNVTGAWDGVFYYLDKLGGLGLHGHDAVMRQSLYSGRYGLIANEGPRDGLPFPDYWAAVLFAQTMDATVLTVDVNPGVVPQSSTYRVYARCTLAPPSATGNTSRALFPLAAGNVTLLVLNFDPTTTLTIVDFGALAAERYEAVVTSAGATSGDFWQTLASDDVLINGQPMHATRAGSVPTPPFRRTDDPFVLPPLSYAFLVMSPTTAGTNICASTSA